MLVEDVLKPGRDAENFLEEVHGFLNVRLATPATACAKLIHELSQDRGALKAVHASLLLRGLNDLFPACLQPCGRVLEQVGFDEDEVHRDHGQVLQNL